MLKQPSPADLEHRAQNGLSRIAVVLAVARLPDALGNSILIVAIPLYVLEVPSGSLALPGSVLIGVLVSTYGFIYAMAQPLAGALSDWFNRRKVFIQAGLVIIGLCTLGFAAARSYFDLFVLRSLQGVGLALIVPTSLALLASARNRQVRGGTMGLYSTMRQMGLSLGPILGGFLIVTFGFKSVFYTGAALIFLSVALVQVMVPEPVVAASAALRAAGFRVLHPDMLAGGFSGLGLSEFLMANAMSLIATLQVEFDERLDQTALGFGLAYSAFIFSRLLVQVPLGRLSDRIGRKPLIICGLLVMALATTPLALAGSTLRLTLLRALQGAASGAITSPAYALAADLSHSDSQGRQMSVVTVGFGLGSAVGPLLAGVLSVVYFELPFLVAGLMTLAGAWIVSRYVPDPLWAARRLNKTQVGR